MAQHWGRNGRRATAVGCRLWLIPCLLGLASPLWAATISARVRWLPSPSPAVAGYRVYWRILGGVYGPPLDAGTPPPAADGSMSYVVPGLTAALGSAFQVTAYQASGVESARSNEIVLPASVTTTVTSSTTTTSTTVAADSCASPTVVPPGGGVFTGTTAGSGTLAATCAATGAAPEQVFQWTPTVSGVATIQTCSATQTTFDTVLSLRQGVCSGGPELACNDDTPGCGNTLDTANPHQGSRLTPTVTAGQTYYIVVDGYGAASGRFVLTITPPACGSPTVVPAAGGAFTGTTSGASTLDATCAATADAPEQVFQWTPAVSGVATIQTCSATETTFDTVLSLRQGSCGGGPELACNDDTPGCGNTLDTANPHQGSRLTPTVTAGQTYYIVVDGYGGASGRFGLTITPPGCASPTVVPPGGGVLTGTTSGASTLDGSCGATSGAPEQVFQWTPAVSGVATIQTCSATQTTFDTVLYLRQGVCSGGPELACNDDTPGCGNTLDTANPHQGSRLTPTVTAGQTYYIVVDGYAVANGRFALTVAPPGVAPASVAVTLPMSTPAAARRGTSTATPDGPSRLPIDGAAPDACAPGDGLAIRRFALRAVGRSRRLVAAGTFRASPLDPTATGATIEVSTADGSRLYRAVVPADAFRSTRTRQTFRYVAPHGTAAPPGTNGLTRLVLRVDGDRIRALAMATSPELGLAKAGASIRWTLRFGDVCVRQLGRACSSDSGGVTHCR